MSIKKLLSVLLAIVLLASFVGCSTPAEAPAEDVATETADTAEQTADEGEASSEFPDEAVVIIEGSGIPNGEWNLAYLQEQMPDVNFVSKTFDNNAIEQAIKTAFAAGDSVDISVYWPNKMVTFTSSDMALDLTPYLEADPEWSSTFLDGALDIGTYDGKVYAIPDSTVYPCFLVNTDIMAEAGVEVKDNWTWDEFMAACEAIEANTDAFPVGIRLERAGWFVRNGLLQIWDDHDEFDSFLAGEISFTDPRIKDMLDTVAGVYNDGYCYPGEGAISATQDAVMAAFSNGEIAMMADVNAMLKSDIATSGLENVAVVGWPTMGNGEVTYINGGATGYFIPSNVANPEFSVEILKHLTSVPVFENAASNGVVVPVAVDSASADPFAAEYAKDSDRITPGEVGTLSSELEDYINNSMPANYLLYGDEAITEMENMRLAAVGE